MDRSLAPSMSQAPHPSAEESGWTSYLQDLSNASCFSVGGSSLLSDAASSAAWKFSHPHHLPRKLTFKKSRTKQISQDDPLEDTASSPVNSPKVGNLHPTEKISIKVDDHQPDVAASMAKEFRGAEHYSESVREDDDKKEGSLKAESTIDCTDLKERGLCLVPLSMLLST
ncbi:vascular-related unknown protein 1-like isoform X2 [Prosopis cineraria]|uniref:vascular-related unknown protein 1-like isoform X2 n=1 Tax=Prosopis cineraria TaxID=364024 RepID=UPI00240F0245|nr:vascular-related unknown protein 1-like isoform X2 [Prosopis cineraria]